MGPSEIAVKGALLAMGLGPWQAHQGWLYLQPRQIPYTPEAFADLLREAAAYARGEEYHGPA